VYRFSEDGICETVKKTDDDLSPPSKISITEFGESGPLEDIECSKGKVSLIYKAMNLDVAFTSNNAVRITTYKNIRQSEMVDEYCLASDITLDNNIELQKDQIVCGNLRIQYEASNACIAIVDCVKKHTLKFRFLFTDNETLILKKLEKEEKIFGLGENTVNGMNKRGTKEDIWVIHSFEKCDKPIPFMLSTAGFGLYLNSGYRSHFDIGQLIEDELAISVFGNGVDLFIIVQEELSDIVCEYSKLTGHAPLPPKWAFGYWQSTTKNVGQKTLIENIQEFKEKSVGLSVIAIDPVWQKFPLQNLQWNEEYFPKPQQFIDEVKKQNIQLALWTAPFLNSNSAAYKEAVENGYVLVDEEGKPGHITWWIGEKAVVIDFSNPQAAQWWGDKIGELVRQGVKVIKTDGGDTNQTPPFLYTKNGVSFKQAHNLYPLMFARGVYDSMKRHSAGERVTTWQRTAYAGQQKYGCLWGGDQKADFSGGRVLIKAGQQAGMMGIPFWSHDMGGFSGCIPTEEYFIRSYQWGLLSPLSRAHGPVTKPWEKGDLAEKITSKYIALRYRLLPYIYSLGWQSHKTGMPIMRAMLLEYQEDPNVFSTEYQYMLGKDILVAPIFEPSGEPNYTAKREIYLPKGKWYDFWTGQLYVGPRKIRYTADIDTLPLFVKAGAIIPMSRNWEDMSWTAIDLHVYSGDKGEFTLYNDDGHTEEYLNGRYCETKIILEDGKDPSVKICETTGSFLRSDEYDFKVIMHQ